MQHVLSTIGGDIIVPSVVSYADAVSGKSGETLNPTTYFAKPIQEILQKILSEPDIAAFFMELAPHFKFLGGPISDLAHKFSGMYRYLYIYYKPILQNILQMVQVQLKNTYNRHRAA